MNNDTLEITQEDKEMSDIILKILKFQNFVLLMSWGFTSAVVIKQGLRFETNGFIHKGIVEIYYDQGEDLFDIRLLNKDNQIIKLINHVYVDELVEILDLNIEKVNNYNERVNQEYNLSNEE